MEIASDSTELERRSDADLPTEPSGNGKIRLMTLHDLDGRTLASRRAKELIATIEEDIGGDLTVSQRQSEKTWTERARSRWSRLTCGRAVAIVRYLEWRVQRERLFLSSRLSKRWERIGTSEPRGLNNAEPLLPRIKSTNPQSANKTSALPH